MPTLFDPIRLGAIEAPNRIFMAPLTRARGTRDHVPTPMMAEYYAQRASAGLVISEAIGITQQGLGWPYATGLWSAAQVAGWRKVTQAVHEANGRIIAQLWHMGRVVHPSFVDGAQPVSASPTTARGHAHTYSGKQPFATARPLRLEEFPALLREYQIATRKALEAGFDGVQIHAANGYLIDQFLRNSTNLRDDAYGGSIDNRIRLLREVTQAVADTAGADRTGVRLSPNGTDQGVRDSDPQAVFVAAAEALSSIGIAYLELREPPLDGTLGASDRPPFAPAIRKAFKGITVLNSDYDFVRAQSALANGDADAISFGRSFIANPDLPQRFRTSLPLAKNNSDTWFTQGAEGYVDYRAIDTSETSLT
jgi:2,4-dienoyl-CoA reductase-like NADH-dependent reductase (Old Yellow Enzyme family)